jgi:N-acetylneuraminic acid mutarotase
MKYKAIIICILLIIFSSSFLLSQKDDTPEARHGHSMVTLPDGRVMLFGGEGAQGDLKDDLFAYDANGWNNVIPANDPPPARKGHSAWAYGDMYIYGGQGTTGLYDDLWSYNVNTRVWSALPQGGSTLPVTRKFHSLIGYDNGLYLYGGTNATGSNLMDFWSRDPGTGNWTQKEIHAPSAGQSVGLHNNDLYIYGGVRWNQNDFRDDVRKYTLPNDNEFHYVYTSGANPGARAYQSATHVGGKMFVAGGLNGSKGVLSDFYEFDMGTETWTQLTDCPIARYQAGMAFYQPDSTLILFGGLDEYGISCTDLCIYDLSTGTWTAVGIDEPVNPAASSLSQNYPNPFLTTTEISFFTTENTEHTEIIIYNLKGQKVKTLADEAVLLGEHSVTWNGKDEQGNDVTPGLYFYKLNVNGKNEAMKKCVLMK